MTERAKLGNPGEAAATLLAGSDGPLAVDARSTTNDGRGIAIWVPPDLYIIRLQRSTATWEHYIHPTLDPILASWAAGERSRYRQIRGATRQPLQDAADWLDALDIQL